MLLLLLLLLLLLDVYQRKPCSRCLQQLLHHFAGVAPVHNGNYAAAAADAAATVNCRDGMHTSIDFHWRSSCTRLQQGHVTIKMSGARERLGHENGFLVSISGTTTMRTLL